MKVTPSLSSRQKFLQLLTAAEQAIEVGAINEGFLELVRELSDLASTELAQYLSVDRTMRNRLDAVWAVTDPEILRTAARGKARALVEKAEGQADRDVAGIVRELRALEKTHGLEVLYGDDADLGDRADLVIQGWKESRL
jgi:hypothetical protein